MMLCVRPARHSTAIYRFVCRLTRGTAIAADAVGRVAEGWRHARREDRAQASTWFPSIVRHKALSAQPQSAKPHPDGEAGPPIADQATNPGQILLQQRRAAAIAYRIGALPRGERQVIDLLYVRAKPFSQVVAVIGAPKRTNKISHVLRLVPGGRAARSCGYREYAGLKFRPGKLRGAKSENGS